ncbi:MAG: acylneuraminate cytidylyltransferase family protein [Lachnospiraceae bacterium]|nr:acylneuraminate cytidylyltransferase family protein [Lachnospiraceae bacterium]
MYKDKKILALIPARGGSKGIPNKNITDLAGKPLIAYSIDACKGSRFVDDIVVSTDSEKIATITRTFGAEVPFMRPEELAMDTSKTLDAVLHAVSELKKQGREYDSIVLIQPTQPLRTSEDIDGAIDTYYINSEQDVVSVCEVSEHPLLMRTLKEGVLVPLLDKSSTCRRQDMDKYYKVNGCVYVNSVNNLNENTSFNDNLIPYVMDRSHSIDIDEPADLKYAEVVITGKYA